MFLDHFNSQWSKNCELEADRWACETGIKIAKSGTEFIAYLVGAWFALSIAERLELELTPSNLSTHPSGGERISELLKFARETSSLNAYQRWKIVSLIDEGRIREDNFRTQSEALRTNAGSNTLSRLLDLCVSNNDAKVFKDQMPRWALLGFPGRLCLDLAKERVMAELALKKDQNNNAMAQRLKLIMWVFRAADDAKSDQAEKFLSDSYRDACRELGYEP